MSQTFNPISQSKGNVLFDVIDISNSEEFFSSYATCETHSTPIVIKKEVNEKEKEELKVEKEEGEKKELKTDFYKMRAVQMKERQEKINEIEKRKKEEEKQLQDLKDEEKREEEARLRKYIPKKIASKALEDLTCFRPNQKSYQWVSRFCLLFSLPPSFCCNNERKVCKMHYDVFFEQTVWLFGVCSDKLGEGKNARARSCFLSTTLFFPQRPCFFSITPFRPISYRGKRDRHTDTQTPHSLPISFWLLWCRTSNIKPVVALAFVTFGRY